MKSLHSILAALSPHAHGFSASISEDWLQGRTVFGGLIAALGNASMRTHVAADRPLRALQIVYVGPNAEGEVEFESSVLREGKAVTLASCTVRSAGQVSATLTAMYGAGRASQLNQQPKPKIVALQPEQLNDVPVRQGLPSFTQHYQQRWAQGMPPFSRATDSAMSVYVRYRGEDTERTSETHAIALMDAIPSPALAMLATPGPASTLSWTLEILDTHFEFGMDGWWRLDADVDAAKDGYVVHSGYVVNPAGHIAAISRQVVVVYG